MQPAWSADGHATHTAWSGRSSGTNPDAGPPDEKHSEEAQPKGKQSKCLASTVTPLSRSHSGPYLCKLPPARQQHMGHGWLGAWALGQHAGPKERTQGTGRDVLNEVLGQGDCRRRGRGDGGTGIGGEKKKSAWKEEAFIVRKEKEPTVPWSTVLISWSGHCRRRAGTADTQREQFIRV